MDQHDTPFTTTTEQIDHTSTLVRFHHTSTQAQLTWAEIIELWSNNGTFQWTYQSSFAASQYDHFFWECPPINAVLAPTTPYEHILTEAPPFRSADPSDFAEHFARSSGKLVTSFANLGGDAQLVAPCPQHASHSAYSSLAAFARGADKAQACSLWATVGVTLQHLLAHNRGAPVWLNTEGSGVPWLHVRLDARPKYYHHRPYKTPA